MKRPISSKLQISLIMMIFMIPLILFLVIYNLYTINLFNRRIARTGQESISMYQNSLEEDLRDATTQMQYIIANDMDFISLSYAKSALDIYLCSEMVKNKIDIMLSTNTSITACYFYNIQNGACHDIYNEKIPYNDKFAIRNYLIKLFETKENIPKGEWYVQSIDEKNYLLRIFCTSKTLLAYVTDLDRIEKPPFSSDSQDSFLFYTDDRQRILTGQDILQEKEIEIRTEAKDSYYLTGRQRNYLIVQDYFEYGGFDFVYAVPYVGWWRYFDSIEFWIVFFSVFIFFLMFISFRFLKIWYFDPLQELSATMAEIKNGKIDAQMPPHKNILEFNMFSNTFNEMMEQIKSLKIETYERELESQQAKLQYLQIQISPHFFLNCLKNIYALAQGKKYLQIQDMTLALSSHLRHMFRNNLVLIPLCAELESVKNYISLQQMSAAYSVSYDMKVAPELLEFEIPPLAILTFVENVFKHAQVVNKFLMIYIEASVVEGENEQLVDIRIIDNGVGFSEAALQELNGTKEFHYQESHVGIQNVRHRCALIYQTQCTFIFSNITGGACVEMFLPYKACMEGDESY